jgi:hypothetical protein
MRSPPPPRTRAGRWPCWPDGSDSELAVVCCAEMPLLRKRIPSCLSLPRDRPGPARTDALIITRSLARRRQGLASTRAKTASWRPTPTGSRAQTDEVLVGEGTSLRRALARWRWCTMVVKQQQFRGDRCRRLACGDSTGRERRRGSRSATDPYGVHRVVDKAGHLAWPSRDVSPEVTCAACGRGEPLSLSGCSFTS